MDRHRFDVRVDLPFFYAIPDPDPDSIRSITKSDCAFYFYSHQCLSISESTLFNFLFSVIGAIIFNILDSTYVELSGKIKVT